MIQLFFPALLIILGIGLLARPRQVPVPAGEVPPADLGHAPELSAVFSQETRRIANTITGGAPLVAICPVALGPCIVIMFVCKLIGANIVRLILRAKRGKA